MKFAVDKETGYILPEPNFATNHRIEDGKYKRLDPGKREYVLDLMELDVADEDVPFVKLVDGELVVDRGEYETAQAEAIENAHKTRRAYYMDAYRKYQAAVNYGEIASESAVDDFIQRLRDKDWAAFDEVPAGLMYFAGECGFAESGLEPPDQVDDIID